MRGSSRNVVREKFRRLRGGFVAVAGLSCAVNVLMLTGPMFMLQVYDRVLASRSIPTLLALLGLAIALYAMMGVFDFLRSRVLSRIAAWLDLEVSPVAFRSWLVRSQSGSGGQAGYRPLQDVATMRGFLGSPTILALFDLPWFPVYLAVVFLLHFWLGALAVFGALVVICLALANEWLTARSASDAAHADIAESRFADGVRRGADTVLAMGMVANVSRTWSGLRDRALFEFQTGAERSEVFTASSKAFRLLLQSAILALGAYLAILQEISAGMIVAASIIAGRALAPIDQTIGGWRTIKRARLARNRLTDYLERDTSGVASGIRLPSPKGHLQVSAVLKRAPQDAAGGQGRPILSGIDFALEPGDGLGVIGPSASGKSSLARLLVGLWMPDQGAVRLDGATFEQWDPDDIGPHIGYLPQEIVLMPGTIAQNIGRFDPQADHMEIVAAAQAADVHDMILRLPDGYATVVDDVMSPLTGGQRQRIAFARAIFRRPALIVLDEPNSSLDAEGDIALARAIAALRAAGSVVVVMAHRPSAIASVDRILMLKDGRMLDFGEKEEVLRRVTRAVA